VRRGKPRGLGAAGGQPQIGHADIADHLRERGFNPDSAVIRRALRLTAELLNQPRHLSQHMGGFVPRRTIERARACRKGSDA